MPCPQSATNDEVSAVRRFNRFYTREIGLLRKTFLDTSWTLGEMRVLYEIRLTPGITAREIGRKLNLDTAYLSRLIRKFLQLSLATRIPSDADGRSHSLQLTQMGIDQVEEADRLQRERMKETLSELSAEDRKDLIRSMDTIENILSKGRRLNEA